MSKDSLEVSTVESTAALPAPAVCPLGSGSVLSGRYAIEMCLGEGASAWVFAAIDLLGIPPCRVAVKAFRDGIDPRYRSPCNELTILDRVHAAGYAPNIVQLVNHEVMVQDNLSYLVLECVEGTSLQARIRTECYLDLAEVARLGVELARGLATLHAVGVVHRDLKPSNIRFRMDGTPGNPGPRSRSN